MEWGWLILEPCVVMCGNGDDEKETMAKWLVGSGWEDYWKVTTSSYCSPPPTRAEEDEKRNYFGGVEGRGGLAILMQACIGSAPVYRYAFNLRSTWFLLNGGVGMWREWIQWMCVCVFVHTSIRGCRGILGNIFFILVVVSVEAQGDHLGCGLVEHWCMFVVDITTWGDDM